MYYFKLRPDCFARAQPLSVLKYSCDSVRLPHRGAMCAATDADLGGEEVIAC